MLKYNITNRMVFDNRVVIRKFGLKRKEVTSKVVPVEYMGEWRYSSTILDLRTRWR
jgi:hypothetical protein